MPDPGYVLYAPDIQGKVTNSGVPVPGIVVNYHRQLSEGKCADSKDTAVTDENGEFHIPRRDVFRFFFVFGDPSFSWGICMKGDGFEKMGWVGSGIGYPPSQALFDCEFLAVEVQQNRGFGFCLRKGV